jgi:(2Fe-2S) ferredoxin
MRYKKHVFVCTNQRPDGAARVSCGEGHGMDLVNRFKELIKEKGLQVQIRAQKAGCFDICEFGPNVIVYPEGVHYGKVQLADVESIVTQHLQNDQPVESLRLYFPPKEKL